MGKFVHERSGDDVKTRTRPLRRLLAQKRRSGAGLHQHGVGRRLHLPQRLERDGRADEAAEGGVAEGGQSGVVEVGPANERDVGRVLSGGGDALDADQPAGKQTAVVPAGPNGVFVVGVRIDAGAEEEEDAAAPRRGRVSGRRRLRASCGGSA